MAPPPLWSTMVVFSLHLHIHDSYRPDAATLENSYFYFWLVPVDLGQSEITSAFRTPPQRLSNPGAGFARWDSASPLHHDRPLGLRGCFVGPSTLPFPRRLDLVLRSDVKSGIQ